jgi:hypothetical protein
MSRFVRWNPIPDLPPMFDDASLEDGPRGLVVLLHHKDKRVLRCSFPVVPAYRCTMEECLVELWQHLLHQTGGYGTCWTVRDSFWLKEFSSIDFRHYPNPTHYFFSTAYRCVDVLSHKPPQVEWLKANDKALLSRRSADRK